MGLASALWRADIVTDLQIWGQSIFLVVRNGHGGNHFTVDTQKVKNWHISCEKDTWHELVQRGLCAQLKTGIFYVGKTPGMSWCKNGVFHECFGDGLEPAA